VVYEADTGHQPPQKTKESRTSESIHSFTRPESFLGPEGLSIQAALLCSSYSLRPTVDEDEIKGCLFWGEVGKQSTKILKHEILVWLPI